NSPLQVSYESIFVQDHLKPSVENKLTYMNDVLGSLFGVLQKFEAENGQLKELILLLLHFKHLLRFVVKHSDFKALWQNDDKANQPEEQQKNIPQNGDIFKADYDDCLAKFASLIEKLDFVSENE